MRREDHPLYVLWCSMRNRCANSKNESFYLYGARGVTVCKRWSDFWAFVADVGDRPSKSHTLDRKNGALGYSPNNCRWATAEEQANNVSKNVSLTIYGEKKTIAQWSRDERCVVSPSAFYSRIRKLRWSPKRALTQPPVFNSPFKSEQP